MHHSLTALHAALLLAVGGCWGKLEDDDDDDTSALYDGADGTSDGADGAGSACAGSTAILLEDGSESGYERCGDGAIHRAEAGSFSAAVEEPRCEGTEAWRACDVDADCTERANGACLHLEYDWSPDAECGCVYACASDADCPAGEACLPPGVVETGLSYPSCVPADCSTDADCASGECGVASWHDGCSYLVGHACRTDADACRVDADCADDSTHCGVNWGAMDAMACHQEGCDIGRPLLVDGRARVAPARARGDWAAPSAVRVDDPVARRILAAHWRRVAALEHASVGSFARFTLQLLALGAPPALLADVQAAALDEVAHARLAFGLASALSGEAVGPGPLDLAGAAPALDPAAVLWALVEEACVGETLGAAEAAEAARRCTEPALQAVLERVAADETRHAALAWRCLRWLLDAVCPELRPAVRARALAVARETVEVGSDRVGLPHLGLLGAAELRALRQAAVQSVLTPCLDALTPAEPARVSA